MRQMVQMAPQSLTAAPLEKLDNSSSSLKPIWPALIEPSLPGSLLLATVLGIQLVPATHATLAKLHSRIFFTNMALTLVYSATFITLSASSRLSMVLLIQME